jgi:hypothetical protein
VSAVPAVPVPFHVPELGPSLGRVIVPRRLAEPWVLLDDVRETLATEVMAQAGAARQAVATGDGVRGARLLGPAVWQDRWERAVRQAAGRVAAAIDAEIERTAWRVRMPRRRWRRSLLTPAERRAVAVRLALGGEPLTAALAVLGRALERLAADGDDGAALEWQDALRLTARRLEAAWLALEAAVDAEHERWAPEWADIAAWRPSLWPVVALWLPVAVALIGLGLMLGGYLPAPSWLAALLGF